MFYKRSRVIDYSKRAVTRARISLSMFFLSSILVVVLLSNRYNTNIEKVDVESTDIIEYKSYKVYLDNKYIGNVPNQQIFIDVYNKMKEKLCIDNELDYHINEEVEIIKQIINEETIINDNLDTKQLEQNIYNVLLSNSDSYKINGYRVSIDEETNVYLDSLEHVKGLLTDIQNKYNNSENKFIVSDIKFYNNKAVPILSRVNDIDTMTSDVIDDEVIDVYFANDLNIARVLFKQVDKHTIEQAFNILLGSENDSKIIVKTRTRVEYNETINKPVIVKKDDDKYKNYRMQISPGKNGVKKVEADIISVNGKDESKSIVREQVIQKPEAEVVLVGTKQPDFSSNTNIDLRRPINGGIITSPYGRRGSGMHYGIDIGIEHGTPIHSAAAGKVIFSSYNGGYGNLVKIEHAEGLVTYYAHCSKLFVKEGQLVDKGQKIAAVGATGSVYGRTGVHLHFEVRIQGQPVNPQRYVYK